MEDIDALQMELEAMLSSTVVRKMTLKEELDVLFDIDKYKGRGKLNRKVTYYKMKINHREKSVFSFQWFMKILKLLTACVEI